MGDCQFCNSWMFYILLHAVHLFDEIINNRFIRELECLLVLLLRFNARYLFQNITAIFDD